MEVVAQFRTLMRLVDPSLLTAEDYRALLQLAEHTLTAAGGWRSNAIA